jgi:hypothetical protein
MTTSALAPWETSNKAQGEDVKGLRIITICPKCEEVPPNTYEDFSSGDVICLSGGLVLANRIIDTRPEWRSSVDNSYTNTDYSASDYPDSDYQISD